MQINLTVCLNSMIMNYKMDHVLSEAEILIFILVLGSGVSLCLKYLKIFQTISILLTENANKLGCFH